MHCIVLGAEAEVQVAVTRRPGILALVCRVGATREAEAAIAVLVDRNGELFLQQDSRHLHLHEGYESIHVPYRDAVGIPACGNVIVDPPREVGCRELRHVSSFALTRWLVFDRPDPLSLQGPRGRDRTAARTT